MNALLPIGNKLPPRRDLAGGLSTRAAGYEDPGSIVIPQARDRALEIFERIQRPQDVASTLECALTGEMWYQQMLFQAMLDSWPRLQKNLRVVATAARNAPWQAVPWAERGETPKPESEKFAKEIEGMVWGMKPDPVRGLNGFEGTVAALAMGYFMGHEVAEIHWTRRKDGKLAPKCSKSVPPRYYGYPTDQNEGLDRLMLDPEGGQHGHGHMIDFPPHRFLIGVNGGHPGHPAQAAPLRVLTGYWLAATYGLKWFMQFAQLFGIPFRWATFDATNTKAKAELAAMMENIAARGWGAFPKGTELNFIESSKSGSSLAQRELIALADEQCDIFILGQTLTTSAGDKGSQALGTVHQGVEDKLLAGVCDFVGEILTHQLVPAIAAVNYGPDRTEDLPGIWAKFPEIKDEKSMAERDKALGLLDGSFQVSKEWLYERHAVPMPAAGDELFKDKPDPVMAPPQMGPDGKPIPPKPGEEKQEEEQEGDNPVKAAAAEAATESPYDMLGRWAAILGKGGVVDDQAIADILAAAWIRSAAEGRKVKAGYNPNQPRVPGGEDGGQWVKDGGSMKPRKLKKGIKLGETLYNRGNPAPADVAFAAAKQLADSEDPGDFGRILSEMGHREWDKTVPGALEYRNKLSEEFQRKKSQAAEKHESTKDSTLQRLGISPEEMEEIASETTSYTASVGGGDKFSHLVFRGGEDPPTVQSVRQAGGDVSRISGSTYPVVELQLSNGGRIFEKIRLSDHAQVSSNAPRHYQHDYRAETIAEAWAAGEMEGEMNELAAEIWERQRDVWTSLKK